MTLGPDLTNMEQEIAKALIIEYADCFTLTVGEVTQVPDMAHQLNIPENTKFSTKIHQHPLTPPQQQFLNRNFEKMLDARVIKHIEPSQVKCISPMTLAQKAHENGGLALEDLKQCINAEC